MGYRRIWCCRHNVSTQAIQLTTDSGALLLAIDARTTRHPIYSVSQRIRKKIEEIFGWMKTVGGFRKTRYRGSARTQLAAWWVGAAYNLMRMARLTV